MAAVQVDLLLGGIRDQSGNALVAGKVYTYEAGTTTNKTTWTDVDKTTPAANPIILDAYGRAQIYGDGNYKFLIKTSADATLYTWDDLIYKTQDSSQYYSGNSTGSANAYVLTNTIPVAALIAGMEFTFIANFSNTASCTVNVDSIGVKTVKLPNASNCIGGEIAQNRQVTIIYDGTNFVLTRFAPEWTSWTPSFGSSAGSLTLMTATFAKFQHFGDRLKINVRTSGGSLASAAATYLTFTLPKACASLGGAQTLVANTSGSSPSFADMSGAFPQDNSTSVHVYADPTLTTSGWAIGTGLAFGVNGEINC